MRVILPILLAFFLATPALAGGPVGFVAAAKGDAQVNEKAARIGLEVFEGDRLTTGEKSRLKVLFSDDAILSLGSETEVVVEKHLFDPKSGARSTRLDLVQGTLRSLVQKIVAGNQADFVVKTGNAVAGVRGTEFVLVAAGPKTRLYTYSGAVDLSGGSGEQVLVAAGQGSGVGDEGEASPPAAVAGVLLKQLREATDSEQSPTAVAWNLKLGKGDRLVAGSEGVDTAEEGELDQEAMPAAPGDLDDPGPKIDPCPDCFTERDDVATAGGGFGAGDAHDGIGGRPNLLDGSWINPEQGINFDPGVAASLTLRVVIHRENRR